VVVVRSAAQRVALHVDDVSATRKWWSSTSGRNWLGCRAWPA
jgi:hypothetical protein